MAVASGCSFRNCRYPVTAPSKSPACCFCMASCTSCCCCWGVICACAGAERTEARTRAKRSEGFCIPATVLCYQNKYNGTSEALRFYSAIVYAPVESEVKLRAELYNALSLLLVGGTEGAIRLGNDLRDRILLELQCQIAAGGKRIQRMVEEVVSLRTDLQLHAFPDAEVLEDREIRVEVRRTVGYREHYRAALAGHRRSGEATRVHEDMRTRLRCVVAAGVQRVQHLVTGSQDGLIVNGDTSRVRPADRAGDDRSRLRARDTSSCFRRRRYAGNSHVVVEIRRLVADIAAWG